MEAVKDIFFFCAIEPFVRRFASQSFHIARKG